MKSKMKSCSIFFSCQEMAGMSQLKLFIKICQFTVLNLFIASLLAQSKFWTCSSEAAHIKTLFYFHLCFFFCIGIYGKSILIEH